MTVELVVYVVGAAVTFRLIGTVLPHVENRRWMLARIVLTCAFWPVFVTYLACCIVFAMAILGAKFSAGISPADMLVDRAVRRDADMVKYPAMPLALAVWVLVVSGYFFQR